jgi:predicted metal-dependent phosphoesterase TrpH
MKLSEIDMSRSDMHFHSVASDGEMKAEEIISAASELKLRNISITDHDGVGAYKSRDGKLNDLSKKTGVNLITGIEFDTEFRGVEIHILGYGFDYKNPDITRYLEENHRQRNERIIELIRGINEFYGKDLIKESEIFLSERETLMKPHLIKVLLKKRLFKNYPDAKIWLQKNIEVKTKIKKPSPDFIINLINNSGGEAVIAHPGFYLKPLGENGFNNLMNIIVHSGLLGIEVFYDYSKLSPGEFSKKEREKLQNIFIDISDKFGLVKTRGSDSHSQNDFMKRNNRENF